MFPTHARKLLTVPVRALAVAVATLSAVLAVWHGGQFALQAVGSSPASSESKTLLGICAAVVGSSLVPGWLTVRNYVLADRNQSDEE